jgi:glucose/arabinose dehydrogenase
MRLRLRTTVVAAAVALACAACLPAPPLSIGAARTGLNFPWDVAWTPANASPAGALVYTERPNGLTIVSGSQTLLHWKPADLLVASEAGMMSFQLAPDFAASRRIFVCFASTAAGLPDVRIARLVLSPGYTTVTQRTDILTGAPINPTGELGRHSGCRLKFGPDGALWVGTGDSAVGTVPQNPLSLGGKILRIDQNGAGVAGNAGFPFDPRIHSWGHRNVQGIAFRGLQAFAVEHGTGCDDEVNRLVVGNYGWDPIPQAPGHPQYDESAPMTDLRKFPNAIRASWSSGCPTIAPSGGTFVNGSQWGFWNGGLVLGVLKGQQLRVLLLTPDGRGTRAFSVAFPGQGRLRTPAIGPDGALYVTTGNGGNIDKILRITPRSVAGLAAT